MEQPKKMEQPNIIKITITENRRPSFSNRDYGMWRRIILIPFIETKFKDDKKLI